MGITEEDILATLLIINNKPIFFPQNEFITWKWDFSLDWLFSKCGLWITRSDRLGGLTHSHSEPLGMGSAYLYF